MNGNSIRKEIVEKADIVNIVSQYVKLEKRGNNYKGSEELYALNQFFSC